MTNETPRWGYLGYEEHEIPGTPPDLPPLRDEDGKFRRGDYYVTKANRLARLRDAAIDAVSIADLQAIMKKQVELAKAGDKTAANFVFDRILGKQASVKVVEDRSVNVQIRNLSQRELDQLEELAMKTVETKTVEAQLITHK